MKIGPLGSNAMLPGRHAQTFQTVIHIRRVYLIMMATHISETSVHVHRQHDITPPKDNL